MTKARFETPQTWTTITTGRNCGPCTACCTHLGVVELRKHAGVRCIHLRGPAALTKRCGIYHKRPSACAEYKCFWLAGWGPRDMRPNDSGILATAYDSERGKPGMAGVTVHIFDSEKAKPHLKQVIGELLTIPMVDEVRLVFLATKKAIMFRDGNVYDCRLLPAEGYEELSFEAFEPPVGHYEVQKSADRAKAVAERGRECPQSPTITYPPTTENLP